MMVASGACEPVECLLHEGSTFLTELQLRAPCGWISIKMW